MIYIVIFPYISLLKIPVFQPVHQLPPLLYHLLKPCHEVLWLKPAVKVRREAYVRMSQLIAYHLQTDRLRKQFIYRKCMSKPVRVNALNFPA